jgi:cytochrome P450
MPDYGVIQSLPYLDQVVQETLRLHAPLGTIIRSCTKDYVLQVNKGTLEGIKMITGQIF